MKCVQGTGCRAAGVSAIISDTPQKISARLFKIFNRRHIFRKSFLSQFIDGGLPGLSILVELVEKFYSRPDFCAEQVSARLGGFCQRGNGEIRRPLIGFAVEVLYLAKYFVDLFPGKREELGSP